MTVPILLLFICGALNFILGITWNLERQRITGLHSNKYMTLYIIGILETVVTVLLLILMIFDF